MGGGGEFDAVGAEETGGGRWGSGDSTGEVAVPLVAVLVVDCPDVRMHGYHVALHQREDDTLSVVVCDLVVVVVVETGEIGEIGVSGCDIGRVVGLVEGLELVGAADGVCLLVEHVAFAWECDLVVGWFEDEAGGLETGDR